MASTPENGAAAPDVAQDQNVQLPLFYKTLVPLSSQQHANFGVDTRDKLEFVRGVHAVPLTIDEFASAQRHYPIIFTTGDTPAPLALLGLQEGQNFFLNDDGSWREGAYVPAYVRRYPFMLARLRPDSDDLSLCLDTSCEEVHEGAAQPFFENSETTEITKNILKFCEEYERSIQKTRAFGEELKKHDLLMDGEVSIQPAGAENPFVYRGFQMVNEQKLKDLRGDQARKLVQNGALPLAYAHLLSVPLIRDLFALANPDVIRAASSATAPATNDQVN